MNTNSKFKIILFLLSFFLILSSCGAGEKLKNIRKPVDLAKTPLDPDERARKNIEEGKGISIGSALGGNRKTNYEFSTSNPMWRASLETLDFLPLATVDYSGGMIITDWYSDTTSDKESIKISLRFLGNDIRGENLKVIVHKKTCNSNLDCKVNLLNKTKIKEELHTAILRKAALLEKEAKKKK
tara:strand:+ start:51 stop:602 length:552 start_codon:yes stop_codon:yes gene_type:complete